MKDEESSGSSPMSPNSTPDDEWEEDPRVSSLRPAASGFSQRRLLNVLSVAIAGVVLVALAIHWLPNALPHQPDVRATHTSHASNALMPPIRGSGWKAIGPDSAQDISFTANGALGYACDKDPLNAIISLTVYDVHQNTWMQLPTPATGDSCNVFVSPDAGNYVVIAVDSCLTPGNCSDSYPASRLYDSYDGGESWEKLPLPALMNVYDAAWENSTLFLATRGDLTTASTTIPLNAPNHLFVGQRDGSFAEIDAQQLVGRSMQFSNISLLSSGTALYASLGEMSCAGNCTIQVRSVDDDAHWTTYSATYQGNPITLQATQPYTNTLVGWAFLPTSGVLAPLRSDDNGDHWRELPTFPVNPATGGAVMYALPDNDIYAFCYGDASVTYVLRAGANAWQTIAPLPTGTPVTVQYDAIGHAVALWGRAIPPTSALGLEYYPLSGFALRTALPSGFIV